MPYRMQLAIDEVDGLKLVRVGGELDAFGAQSFRERVGLLRRAERVVVDLSELAFIDSAGLHALFAVARGAKDVGAGVAFVVPPESPVRRVIELVLLGEVAPICESLEDAVASSRASNVG
jgi:anti-sigma B factor antagonist